MSVSEERRTAYVHAGGVAVRCAAVNEGRYGAAASTRTDARGALAQHLCLRQRCAPIDFVHHVRMKITPCKNEDYTSNLRPEKLVVELIF